MAATYLEFYNAATSNNGTILQRIAVACVFAAEVVRIEAEGTKNHAKRLVWAQTAYANPDAVSRPMLWALIGQNSGVPVEKLSGFSDSDLQKSVDAAVDVVAGS